MTNKKVEMALVGGLATRCNRGALLNLIRGACRGILYHWKRQLMGWDDNRI